MIFLLIIEKLVKKLFLYNAKHEIQMHTRYIQLCMKFNHRYVHL